MSKIQFNALLSELSEKVGNSLAPNKVEKSDFNIVKSLKKENSIGNMRITRIGGATESSQHSFDEDELEQFVHHINIRIQHDKFLGKRFPIEPKNFFEECSDGLILR